MIVISVEWTPKMKKGSAGGEVDAEKRGLGLGAESAESASDAVGELATRRTETTVAVEGTSKNQKSGQRAVVVYALVCPFKGVQAQ